LVNPNYGTVSSADSLNNSYFNITTISSSFLYTPTPSIRFHLRGGIDERDFNVKDFFTRSSYDESVEQTTNLWLQSSLNYQREKHFIEFGIGQKEVEDVFTFNSIEFGVSKILFFNNLIVSSRHIFANT